MFPVCQSQEGLFQTLQVPRNICKLTHYSSFHNAAYSSHCVPGIWVCLIALFPQRLLLPDLHSPRPAFPIPGCMPTLSCNPFRDAHHPGSPSRTHLAHRKQTGRQMPATVSGNVLFNREHLPRGKGKVSQSLKEWVSLGPFLTASGVAVAKAARGQDLL